MSAIPKVLSSMTAIEGKLKRIDRCMDLTQTRLSIVERIWLDNPVKDFKSDVGAMKTTRTHLIIQPNSQLLSQK